jgi:hypothetical protein
MLIVYIGFIRHRYIFRSVFWIIMRQSQEIHSLVSQMY